MQEISDHVSQLRTECPSDWSPIKKDNDEDHIDMRSKYEQTMEYIGKASPVSIRVTQEFVTPRYLATSAPE